MIIETQSNIRLERNENGNLKMSDEIGNMLFGNIEMNWKLVREHDGLIKQSVDILWLEFNENATFKSKHSEIAIGRSLIMSPFNQFFTWQTTPVTEIVENREDYIKFYTKNSTYELYKLNTIN